MVDEVTRVVESFITVQMRTSVRFDSTVSIQVSLKSLATGELLATNFADVFTNIRVRFGMAVAVTQAGETLAANGALERFLFGVCPLVSYQVTLFTKTHSAFITFNSELAIMSLYLFVKMIIK